jgi:hypothetical protein
MANGGIIGPVNDPTTTTVVTHLQHQEHIIIQIKHQVKQTI